MPDNVSSSAAISARFCSISRDSLALSSSISAKASCLDSSLFENSAVSALSRTSSCRRPFTSVCTSANSFLLLFMASSTLALASREASTSVSSPSSLALTAASSSDASVTSALLDSIRISNSRPASSLSEAATSSIFLRFLSLSTDARSSSSCAFNASTSRAIRLDSSSLASISRSMLAAAS